jgi:hypothetical protein
VLLPGDDVAAFRTLRRRLFRDYKPRTMEEALCVETIAASHWRIARCRLELGAFKRQLGAVLSGDPDTIGTLCRPDPHRVHHRGADCVLEEGRLERFKNKARATLILLQKQRAQNFTAADSGLEDYQVFLAEGEPALEEEQEPAVSKAEVAVPATAPAERRSANTRNRNERTPTTRFSETWRSQKSPAAAARGADSPLR